jgi:hypothetical protein
VTAFRLSDQKLNRPAVYGGLQDALNESRLFPVGEPGMNAGPGHASSFPWKFPYLASNLNLPFGCIKRR